jgi:hypothetical protein
MRTAAWDSWVERARAVRIEDVTARRGIKLNGKGAARCGPCPQCGGDDRFGINTKKQVFHCRRCGGKGSGTINLVMWLDGVDFIRAVETLAGDRREPVTVVRKPVDNRAKVSAEQDEAEQHRKAAWLWSQRRPIQGSIAETYLREARKITCPLPPTLAFLPPSGDYPPSMIAAYALPNEIEPGVLGAPRIVRSVHVTRLLPDGSGREPGKAKRTIGRPLGLPIVIALVTDTLALTITEGIEDALSVYQATGLGAWAAGASSYMPSLKVPDYVEAVTIIADDDDSGRQGAAGLAQQLHQRGGIEIFLEGVTL